MKQSRFFIPLLTLLVAQSTFICVHAKTLTPQETTALNLEQKELQIKINKAVADTKNKMLNVNKAQQINRDVELAKNITRFHKNKAKLVGRG